MPESTAQELPGEPVRNLLTPKLVAVVLGMDAGVVFFAALTAFGLRRLEPGWAFGGGAILLLAFVVLAGLARRHAWVVWAGWAGQLVLVALGFVLTPMFFVGAGSIVLWVWCLMRGRKVDREPLDPQEIR